MLIAAAGRRGPDFQLARWSKKAGKGDGGVLPSLADLPSGEALRPYLAVLAHSIL